MRSNLIGVCSGAVALALAMPAISCADSIQLRHDDVIPLVMQTELSFTNTHEGDLFKGEVADSRMLPNGSKVEGIVNRVVQKDGKRKAFMDIEFTTIILPGGHRTDFHGTPIPLSKQYVVQDRDGRWEAKKGVSKDTVVLGSIAGGFILGSMIHKQFEGAFLGALIGVIAGETDKEDVGDGNIVIAKGGKMGARVDKDLAIQFDGHWGDNKAGSGYSADGYDKYGYDRDGHYNPKYDTTRGDSHADRGAADTNSGYDKYGYDHDGHYNPKYDTTRDAPPPSRGSDRDMRVEIDRKAIHYLDDEHPYRKNWIVMVPLRTTAEQLGYHVSKDGDTGYRVENDNDVLVIDRDSRDASLNHHTRTLPSRMEMRDGVAYVPIDAFTALTKGDVVINGTKYRQPS